MNAYQRSVAMYEYDKLFLPLGRGFEPLLGQAHNDR